NVAALTAAHLVHPCALRLHRVMKVAATLAGYADGCVVLLRAAHLIRNISCRCHVVELRRGIVLRGPRLAVVYRDCATAVIRLHHAPRVVRIDPHIVVVTVWLLDRLER